MSFISLVKDAVAQRPKTKEERRRNAKELSMYFTTNERRLEQLFLAMEVPATTTNRYVVGIGADMVAHIVWRTTQVECLERRSVDSGFKCSRVWCSCGNFAGVGLKHVTDIEALDVNTLTASKTQLADVADAVSKTLLAPMMCGTHRKRWETFHLAPEELSAGVQDWRALAQRLVAISRKKEALTFEGADLRGFALCMQAVGWIERFRIIEDNAAQAQTDIVSPKTLGKIPAKMAAPLPRSPPVAVLPKAKRPAERWGNGVSVCILGDQMQEFHVEEPAAKRTVREPEPAPAPEAPIAIAAAKTPRKAKRAVPVGGFDPRVLSMMFQPGSGYGMPLLVLPAPFFPQEDASSDDE